MSSFAADYGLEIVVVKETLPPIDHQTKEQLTSVSYSAFALYL